MKLPVHPDLAYFVLKECTSSWRLDNPSISFYELVFILKGKADYSICGSSYSVREGNVLFLIPGSSRKASTAGMSCAALDFHLHPGEDLQFPTVTVIPDSVRKELESYLQEINYEWMQKNPGSAVRCQAFFLLLLHRLLYQPLIEPCNPRVESMKRYIVEHYREKITVSGLAAYCGIHPAYCGALFKKTEGCSISSYVQSIRVNKAAALLETGEYPVGTAAELTGFQDIYHFSSVFKRVTGESPTAYRLRSARRPPLEE